MRKHLLLLVFVLLSFTVFAKHVDEVTALNVAKTFWAKNVQNGNTLKASVNFTNVTSETGFSNFYVFTTTKGFVIVSADDIATPILGYSDNNDFIPTNIPAHVREWLQVYESDIAQGVANGLVASEEIAADWNNLLNGNAVVAKSTRAVAKLVQTSWDQTSPYNNLCPGTGSNKTVTGCVATAMAQVMKYWNYPTQGNGSYSYTQSPYGTISANFGTTTYDWNNMLNTYTSSATNAQKTAVATLMYHCGVAVEMEYDIASNGGSGAVTLGSAPSAEAALKNYFLYKSTLRGYNKSSYSDTNWKNMLKADLDAGRPIVYSGRGSEGGHCFVCDGYDSNNKFHFNWGWSGYYDGFFALTNLNPGTGGTGSGSGTYTNNQGAILGIEPNSGLFAIPNALTISGLGGSQTFMVRSSTSSSASWSATSNQSWLTINPASGAGSGSNTTVTATAPRNNTANERTAVVTITQGSSTATVTITQPSGQTQPVGCYGNEDFDYYYEFVNGNMFIIRSEGFGYFETGHKVTSVKFKTYDDDENTNNSFQIRIYEGSSADAVANSGYSTDVTAALGTMVYSQNYTQSSYGEQEVTLNTPYTIDENTPFWIAVVTNGNTAVLEQTLDYGDPIAIDDYSSSAAAYDGKYLYVDTYNGTNYINTCTGAYYADETYETVQLYGWDFALSFCTQDPSHLSVSPTSLSYVAAGEAKTFTVQAGGSSARWNASSSASWLTLSATSGNGSGASATITATAAQNTTNGARTATITVTHGTETQTIEVTQAAYALSVTPTSLDFISAGAAKTFTVQAGGSSARWSATSSAAWLTLSPASGNGAGATTTVTATAAANTGDARTATITVTHGTETKTIAVTQSSAIVDGWYGNEDYDTYEVFTATHEIIIRPEQFGNFDAGNKVLKVKFATYQPTSGNYVSYNNNSFTIRIYENCSISSDMTSDGYDMTANVLNTPVYTQNYTQVPSSTINENIVELTTPYEINGNNFWISVVANGPTLFLATNEEIGEPVAVDSYSSMHSQCNKNYLYTETYTSGGTDYELINLNYAAYYSDNTYQYVQAYNVNYDLAFYLSQNGTYEESSDIAAALFGGIEDGYLVNAPASYDLEATDDLVIYPFYRNNGADDATTGTVTMSITLGDQIYWTQDYDMTQNSIAVGGWYSVVNSPYAVTISADDMDEMGLTGDFNVCYSVSYTGNDHNESNNSQCVPVTRAAVPTYTIVATANPTAAATITGAGIYESGTSATLTATPNAGYQFVSWTENGSVVSSNATYTFTVTGNRTLVANFTLNSYNVSVVANPVDGGSVTGAGTYNHNSNVIVSATANIGYQFANWTEDGSVVSTNANYSFQINASRSLVANFLINSYTITANANNSAWGTVTGGGSYNYNATATLTATPEAHYHFVSWSDGNTQNPRYITVTESASYTAIFAIDQHLITVVANPSEGGTVTGGGTYDYGSSITINATANTGYHFVSWSDNSIAEASRSYVVSGDATITANFVENEATTYVITATAGNGGTITPAGSIIVAENNSQAFTMTPNQYYTLTSVLVDNVEVISTVQNNTYTFNNVNNNHTIAAFFTEVETYVVVTSANPTDGGSTSGDGIYHNGDNVVVNATANAHYTFTNWTENGTTVSNNASYSFNINENRNLVANFQIDQFTIIVNGENSTTTGTGSYDYGQTVQISATANEHYHFVSWSDGSTENPRTIIVTSNATYNAICEIDQYTITTSANGNGTVNGGGIKNYGDVITLNAIPDEGYHFVRWNDNETANPRQHTVVADAEFVAFFEINAPSTYTITAIAGENGTINPTGNVEVEEGDDQIFTIAANEGFVIETILIDGTAIDIEEATISYEYTFTAVNANHTIEATFTNAVAVDMVAVAFSAYPNPTSNILNVISSETITSVEIISITGQVISRMDVSSDTAVCNVEILAPGTYFVRVFANNNSVEVIKFVKE